MITAAIAPAMIAAASVMFGCFIHHDRSRRTGGAEGSRCAAAAVVEPRGFVEFAPFAELAVFVGTDVFGRPEFAVGEVTIEILGGLASFFADSAADSLAAWPSASSSIGTLSGRGVIKRDGRFEFRDSSFFHHSNLGFRRSLFEPFPK